MERYRHFLVGQKRVWMASGRGSRCLRGLVHYLDLVEEYLAAKRLCLSDPTSGNEEKT